MKFQPALSLFTISGLAASVAFAGDPSVPTGFRVETAVDGLDEPTAFAFVGPNELLICEKATGKVRHAVGGALQPDAVDLPVNADSERGLLGIALHPNFAQNDFVYLYYSRAAADGESWQENRVARFTWNGSTLTGETTIIAFSFDPNQANGANHDGGVIVFGPDGKLYGVTGDLNRDGIEQNGSSTESSGVGGVFRLNDDGTVPADNPFAAHAIAALRPLFSYGLRNSFGLAFDPQNGRLWDTENGPSSYDEINVVPRGHNSGWTPLMGPDSRDSNSVSDLVMLPGAVYSDPEFSFATPVGITSVVVMNSLRYPASLQNCLLVGDNNTGSLYRLPFNGARDGFVLSGGLTDLVADSSGERGAVTWGTSFNVTTDLEIGPDGYLYVCDLVSGAVRRITTGVADLNCDGTLDFFDIDPFLLALFDATGYAAAFPNCSRSAADVNADGAVDFFDIDGFLACLFGTCP